MEIPRFVFFEPDFLAEDSPGQGPGLGRLAASDRMAGLASSWVAAATVALTKRIEHRRRLAVRTLAEGLGSQEERQTFSDFQAQITISLGNPFKTIVILGGNLFRNWVCVC